MSDTSLSRQQRPDTYNYHRRFECDSPVSFTVTVSGQASIAVCTQHLAKAVREQTTLHGVDNAVVQILGTAS